MQKTGFFENRKGVSVMVGYVLLVVFLIIIGGIVYQWLKTYVPKQALECPDGTSIFIKEASFDSDNSQLIVTLRNNGRFDLAGYFIHATNSSEQELPTIDLSGYLNKTQGGKTFGNSVLFVEGGDNFFGPSSETTHFFDIPAETGVPYSVRIIPTRFQEVEGRSRFVSCSDARSEQVVGEAVEECIPDCTGRVCGPDPVCGEICLPNNCAIDEFCDAAGQCISTSCTPAADPTLSGICGSDVCETATNGTCGEVSCGTCNTEINEICISGQCTTIGNGICDPGETCANEPACEGQQAQCSPGQICQSGSCVFQGGTYNEDDYCRDLGLGYGSGDCVANTGQCQSQGGINENDELGASVYCPGQILCCFPSA